MSKITVERIKGGTDNCYLVIKGNDAVLVDTSSARSRELVEEACSKYNLKLIVLTHTHFDHADNAAYLSEKFNVPVAYHKADDKLFDSYKTQPLLHCGLVGWAVFALSVKELDNAKVQRPSNAFFIKEGDTFDSYGFPELKVVELPGHTKGSIGVLAGDDDFIVGDAMDNWIRPSKAHLFCDFPTSIKSVGKIRTFAPRTVYYGHGKPTRITK